MQRHKFHIADDLSFIRVKDDVKIELDKGGWAPTQVWSLSEEMVRGLVNWLLNVG